MQDTPQVSAAPAGMSTWAMPLGADLAPPQAAPYFLDALVSGIFFLVSLSDRSLFVYKIQPISAYLFCVLLLC